MYLKYILYISFFITFTSCEFLSFGKREKLLTDPGRYNYINNEEMAKNRQQWKANYELATLLGEESLKHIEAKYPHSKKQAIVRILSLDKQVVAGVHYRLKMEVGPTDCMVLSGETNCKLEYDSSFNKFCRVNIWIRPWLDQPSNFKVSCDVQEGSTELHQNLQDEQLFNHFLLTHNPSYVNNRTETERRFLIFKENIKKIHDLNVNEMGTATYCVTRFTDLTKEEFRARHTGLNPSMKTKEELPKAVIPPLDLPENFDWRELGAVTPVKDQGDCGSCWAFSVVGNIESHWQLRTGNLESLSEQELLDCDKTDGACYGGWPDNTYRVIKQLGGLELESDYPYEAKKDKCQLNSTLTKVTISGGVNITSNETGMAIWLIRNGPITIAINSNGMQYYKGGISHLKKALCEPEDLDHAVLIVGYGIEVHYLFKKSIPFWIIKNSWGASWGEQGYYRVYRGDGTCGVNTVASSAVL